MTVSRWIILIMRNVSTECVKKMKTHVQNPFSRKSWLLWNNVDKYEKLRQATDNIIRRMRFACWLTKATDTHSEYVILIAFPEQLWFRERASTLRLYIHFLYFSYLYVHCLPCSYLYVHCLSCSYLYVHCLSCSYLYVHCLSCSYLYVHCLSCSYLYVHCLSCSYLYVHCLSCSYLYVRCPVRIYTYIVCPVHIYTYIVCPVLISILIIKKLTFFFRDKY